MKMYSSFISSAFKSLRDERKRVINALLDFKVFPVCQEHFTISANNFEELTDYIDNSDFFILLLGSRYGDCDIDGKSWTQKEYEYAVQARKTILAIKCDEYEHAEEKQRAFGECIEFAEQVTAEFTIEKIITKFFGNIDFSEHSGWIRCEDIQKNNDAWKKANAKFDLAGKWYHAHIGDEEETYSYVRAGELIITQEFDEEHFRDIHIDAKNYDASLDKNGNIVFDKLKITQWKGDYKIYVSENQAEIRGVYYANRRFNGKYKNERVDKGSKKGVHEFLLYGENDEITNEFEGDFNDVTPSPKKGQIYIFRKSEARDEFLKDHLKSI